ncbi:MAG: hypothetical protein JRE28_03920 [Deltaproteobacteria bacterium]|nr:hypothetical protein [Deltaproteobacteria bacterium]
MEKRTDKRRRCEASIAWGCFNKKKTFNAKMLNYSRYGMYFESDVFFKEGVNIYFQMDDCLVDASDPEPCEGLRTISLAEVKWWKNIGGADENHFGVGVKYVEHY